MTGKGYATAQLYLPQNVGLLKSYGKNELLQYAWLINDWMNCKTVTYKSFCSI